MSATQIELFLKQCNSCNGKGQIPVNVVQHKREDNQVHYLLTPANSTNSKEIHTNRKGGCCCGAPSSCYPQYISRREYLDLQKVGSASEEV